jgi:hypothetical protein
MHVLRHSVAMDLLQQGVDRSVIALWLGHESIETTEVYLHAQDGDEGEGTCQGLLPAKRETAVTDPTTACWRS